jgi:hypothetical protein
MRRSVRTVKNLPDGAECAAPGVFRAMAYALARASLDGAVVFALERFEIATRASSFAFERDHDRRPMILELFHGWTNLR